MLPSASPTLTCGMKLGSNPSGLPWRNDAESHPASAGPNLAREEVPTQHSREESPSKRARVSL